MRLCFCAYDRPDYVNGPNVWLVRLASALAERGHRVRVLLLLHGGQGPLSRALGELDVEVAAVERPRFTEDRVRWILDRLADPPPDVFVPNLSVAAYYAARWARAVGIPTVGVLHSDDPFYWALVDEFVRGAEPFRVSAVVCVSRFLEEELAGSPAPGVRVARIPYGVPIPEAAAGRPEGRFRLAYVGRLVEPQKRIGQVVEAMCRAAREVPGVEAIIVGEGAERAAIQRGLRDRGSPPVHLAGRIESDRIQSTLLDCQGFVLLSDFEGLPIALMEAMACGVVPICLRTRSGIEELVTDGESGLLIDDRGDGFVEAVRALATDAGLWRRLSRGARARVREDGTIDRNAERWIALCEELRREAPAPVPIQRPASLDLPPVRDALAREDLRSEPLWRFALTRGRRRAGALWRRLMPALAAGRGTGH